MTATAWEVAATTTVEDNTPETLALQLRAHRAPKWRLTFEFREGDAYVWNYEAG